MTETLTSPSESATPHAAAVDSISRLTVPEPYQLPAELADQLRSLERQLGYIPN